MMKINDTNMAHWLVFGGNIVLLCLNAAWMVWLGHSQYQFSRYKTVMTSYYHQHFNDTPKCVRDDYFSSQPSQYSTMDTGEEAALLNKYLAKAKVYFEFGIGGNTLDALKHKNIKHIYTVDNTPSKFSGFLYHYELVRENEKAGRFEALFVNTDEVGDWGYPKDTWKDYSAYAQVFGTKDDYKNADFILLNGRYRMASLAWILLFAKNNPLIALHNVNRLEYAEVKDFLDEIERADTLAVYKIKPNLNQEELWDFYRKYQKDAR